MLIKICRIKKIKINSKIKIKININTEKIDLINLRNLINKYDR